MPIVVTPTRVAPPRTANPPPKSTIVPRGIPSTFKGPPIAAAAKIAPALIRPTSGAPPQQILTIATTAASAVVLPDRPANAPKAASTETTPKTDAATTLCLTPTATTTTTTTMPEARIPDTLLRDASTGENDSFVPRQATLGALIVHADWSEACSEFVPRALATLTAHPALTGGAIAVHVDAEPCLCARYAVKGVPCIIFRARPTGPSWRLRGMARPFEIPRTRIIGACSEAVLAARIDAAVAAFCRIVPAAAVDPTTATATTANKVAN
ncbi:hypothetical protein pqer_cds_176 [Pandoravirus quercus]|uniref:Thioredoxin domain-containing protein n=1 Tax=Pandoravirus quercus TaxID=2107709 RepID=A0A2U7U831_9VIRU|nr:hypothetical protein pqer_cds_176 [Pandoravirus quercus]AVK74598.1 hypothetical protein pqer_cds_176 [Pandoravirus quercus]